MEKTPHLTFLQEIAERLIADFNYDFENCIVILPNKRAKVFLQDAIKEKCQKFVIAPQIWSIEEFVGNIAEIKKIDALETLFEFYQVYTDVTPLSHRQDFETFSNWAKTVLKDFNEIDTYLINPKHIFSYLKDIDDINHWSLEPNRTQLIEKYITFWEQLPNYYEKLYKHLTSQNKGYQGIIYREAVKKIDAFIDNSNQNKYYFCGFNALNKAEENIFQKMLAEDKAKVIWNIDEFFINDAEHDAGYFARKIKKEWSYYKSHPFENINNYYKNPKKIEIIGTPKSVGQARIVSEKIEKIALENREMKNVAVVLSDENLLIPTLQALPHSIESLNITMGFESKSHPVLVLIQKVFKMHKNAIQRGKNEATYYYTEVLEVLTHPLVISAKETQMAISYIHENNLTFFSWNTINKFATDTDQLLYKIMYPWQDISVEQVLENMFAIIDNIKNQLIQKEDKVSLAFAFTVYQTLKKIKNYQQKYGLINSINLLAIVYKQIADMMQVSFEGKPLEGLQIMGILESRVLDFDTVIITSLNESIFPLQKSNNSFIPYDVKRELGMPTQKEKDAIFSYHFYHLIHRAKKVILIYNNDPDGNKSSEKSRFITQLLLEKPETFDLIEELYIPKIENSATNIKAIKKTPELMQRLQEIATGKGFSPSSFGMYLRDPYLFYIQRVLTVEEIKEVEENIAANTFGIVIHDTLEELYKPYLRQKLNQAMIDEMIQKAPATLHHHFKQKFSKNNDILGKNKLSYEVANNEILHFLNTEKTSIAKGDEIEILYLEEKLFTEISHPILPYPIKIGGKVDRIEKRNRKLSIIDYKTGRVQRAELNVIKGLEKIIDDEKHEKLLQLLCYALMLKNNKILPEEKGIYSGIYSFKNKTEGFMFCNDGKNNIELTPFLDEFQEQLAILIHEILNPEKDFVEKIL